ncbi:MAG: hypothetical protein SF028_10885 [Candidatus Sumerlaeia bacterium]|nr:hypothetical protein [Candidatus Sumerlaeia bacterium]
MRNRRRFRMILATTMLSVSLLTSCTDLQTRNNLKKATESLTRMQTELNGATHAPNELEAIQRDIDRANSSAAAGAGSEALAAARSASSTAEQTLIKVLSSEANAVYNQALEEIRVGDTNNISVRDAERYARIIELKGDADALRAENENEKLIQIGRQIITEVRTALSPLAAAAKRSRVTAEQRLTDLQAEGGQVYAPEVVIAVKDRIQGAINIADNQRDYNLATIEFDAAATEASSGIETVKRQKSREQLDAIEGLLGTALLEGATEYVPEEFEKVNRLNQGILSDFQSARYDRVLEGANQVRPSAETLVLNTKRAASDARIASIQRNIDTLVEGGVREYLPGRIDALEAVLGEARAIRQRDTIEAFDEIKELSLRAIDVNDTINEAFNDLAIAAIRAAGDQIETTQTVYDRMGEVFAPQDSANLTPEQAVFETQKESRRLELGQRLENARRNLQGAFQNQRDARYKQSILQAEEVRADGLAVLDGVYHNVAHNASIQLANLISRYERDGATEYAADELARSQADLTQVKGEIAAGNFRTAVERAAEARANVELMAQAIAGRANVNLARAKEARDNAGSDTVRKYRSSMLDEVQKLIDQAEANLGEAQLKLAVENADAATRLAQQAVREAFRAAADDSLAAAQDTIRRAADAGAELYASRGMLDARNLLQSARSLYASADYEKAVDQADAARGRADAALFKKILDAEAALATAKAVGGFDSDPRSTGLAGARIREARLKFEQGDYAAGNQLAVSAREVATSVSASSRDGNVALMIGRLRDNLDEGTAQGINFFQPEESAAARTRLMELENLYDGQNYDLVVTELTKLEGMLRGTLETTDDTVAEVADAQEKRLEDLVENGAAGYAAPVVEEARTYLNRARLDYRRGLYKSAHTNLEQAISLVNEVALRRDKEAYIAEATSLIARYREAQANFAQILGLDASQVKSLASNGGSTRMVAIATRTTPTEYREATEGLYLSAIRMVVPRGYENVHEQLVDALNEGRVAATQFEKMRAFDSFSAAQVEATVNSAYQSVNSSNSRLVTVEARLLDDVTAFRENKLQIGMAGGR